MKTQKQIFEKASEIVRTRGLKKGDYGTSNGPVCLLGAVRVAAYGRAHIYEEPGQLPQGDLRVLDSVFAETGIHPAEWSDKPSTTTDEVADVLWLLGQVSDG